MRSLRIPGETDEEFRDRAERLAGLARILVSACLANRRVRALIEDGVYREDALRRSPIVRVEYEQAYAIGCIGALGHAGEVLGNGARHTPTGTR